MDERTLIREAFAAREYAYAPYSGFFVGAALLGKSGNIYRGCNVENGSFSATNCAERTAFFQAVAQGERDFAAIAIVGGAGGEPVGFCPPCGVCRQVMAEFCEADFLILLAESEENWKTYTLKELLPESFSLGKGEERHEML